MPDCILKFELETSNVVFFALSRYRWFALVYLIGMFLVFPLIVFSLSQGGEILLVCVLAPVVVIVLFAVAVNAVRSRRPTWLPGFLRGGWSFLPRPLRSLGFYDQYIFSKIAFCNRGGDGGRRPSEMQFAAGSPSAMSSPSLSTSPSRVDGCWINAGFSDGSPSQADVSGARSIQQYSGHYSKDDLATGGLPSVVVR